MTSPYFSSRPVRHAATKASQALASLGNGKKHAKIAAANSQRKSHVKVEYDDGEIAIKKEEDLANELSMKKEVAGSKISPLKRKAITGGTGKLKKEKSDGTDVAWKPQNWVEMLRNIKVMRQDENAPVDSQGCERTADDTETQETIRYQILVSLMLSAQTKDQITFAAMENLKKYGLNVENILKTDEKKIGELIYPVGFWKRKSVYIKQATAICKEKYNGDIPDTLDGLLALPGVGPKMAHICMHAAWKRMTGIGVDTHVHRISNRLGWVKKPTKTPEDTRKALEAWLPREEWETLNVLLVGFGQQTCLPVGPRCQICLNNKICPYGRSAMSGRKPKKEEPDN